MHNVDRFLRAHGLSARICSEVDHTQIWRHPSAPSYHGGLRWQYVLRALRLSGTYDNVKSLVAAGAISLLLDAARAFEEDSNTLYVVFLALKQLAANDESVKLVCCVSSRSSKLLCSFFVF